VIAGLGGIALLVALLLLPWYGLRHQFLFASGEFGSRSATSATGWDSVSVLRWVLLITALVAIALPLFQTSRRDPALPATLSVLVSVLGLIASVGLIFRVVVDPLGPSQLIERRVGGWVALAAGLAVLVGGLRSQRQEGVLEADGPGEIPIATP
jgi:hypothetical protein